MHRRMLAVFTLGTLTLCSGCYKKTIENGATTVTNEWWVPTLFGLGGLVAIVVGVVLLLRKLDWYWPTIAIVLGVMSLGYFTPDTALTKVVVDKETFYSKSGFLFLAKEYKLNLDDITLVRERVKESTGRRGRKEYTRYLVFTKKDNTAVEIEFSGAIKEALPELESELTARGIEIRPL